MSKLDTKDFYDFYGFNEYRHEKIDSPEEVIAKPDHEYVVGVIVIAAFLALSCSNLGMDQELQEDEYEDTKEEEFDASIVSNCCGKGFMNRVSLAIHVKRTHRKCFCYLVEAKCLYNVLIV